MTGEMAYKHMMLLQRTGAQVPAPISRSSQPPEDRVPLAFVGTALMYTHPGSEIYTNKFKLIKP